MFATSLTEVITSSGTHWLRLPVTKLDSGALGVFPGFVGAVINVKSISLKFLVLV